MNWKQHFDQVSGQPANIGAESSATPPWYKRWGIGEWGSVASFIGIGLWLLDQRKKCVPISDLRALKAARRK